MDKDGICWVLDEMRGLACFIRDTAQFVGNIPDNTLIIEYIGMTLENMHKGLMKALGDEFWD